MLPQHYMLLVGKDSVEKQKAKLMCLSNSSLLLDYREGLYSILAMITTFMTDFLVNYQMAPFYLLEFTSMCYLFKMSPFLLRGKER